MTGSAQQRREMVRLVGTAIGDLAKHLASSSNVADAIAEVTAQAKAIAFKAWQVMAGGGDTQKIARELADDLNRIAADMEALANRAGIEAVLSQDAASVLSLAAAEFDAIASDPAGLGDLSVLRARMLPLLG